MWSKFSLEKVIEGSLRIARSQEAKRDLEKRQLELEVNRL
jgi:hypothetical protein